MIFLDTLTRIRFIKNNLLKWYIDKNLSLIYLNTSSKPIEMMSNIATSLSIEIYIRVQSEALKSSGKKEKRKFFDVNFFTKPKGSCPFTYSLSGSWHNYQERLYLL